MRFFQNITTLRSFKFKDWLLITFFTIACIILIVLTYKFIPTGLDWRKNLRAGSLALLNGESPYSVKSFYNPPWTLIPLLPLAILPERVGGTIILLGGLLGYFILLHKLKANIFTTLIFILSPPILEDLRLGNINWLVMLGYIMPPQIGLFFVLMKPQVGGVMVLYWLVEAWHQGGIKRIIKVFLPISITTVLSLIVFGLWPFKMSHAIDVFWNLSLWPYSIPFGLILLVSALKHRKVSHAYMASPFFSPYVALYSYGTVILGLVSSTWETLAAVGGIWLTMLVGKFL
jgi:hypothetical protein